MKRIVFLISSLLLFILFSCLIITCVEWMPQSAAGTEKNPIPEEESNQNAYKKQQQPLLLTFAGDLMAHTVNFNMKQYDLIYVDVEKILHNDDLSFVNIETPVCDSLPLSTYPCFNVHTPYLRAAVQAGFDVLSFANNHTNDQKRAGIDGSLTAARTLQKERAASKIIPQPLTFSGLKDTADEPIRVSVIFYKGWTILFCAVTELLNSYDSSKERLYYSKSTKQGRAALLSVIKAARSSYPCDLFVLSLHLNEPEYVRTVSESKKAWFKQLGEAGIDIIWAHHPHVMQPWEIISVDRPTFSVPDKAGDTSDDAAGKNTGAASDTALTERQKVFCMYSMGNFISGQRWQVRYDDPAFYREYTGDAVLLQLLCTLNESGKPDFSVSPILITQYNEPAYPVVKRFTQDWMDTLNEKEKKYFKSRFDLMKAYLPF